MPELESKRCETLEDLENLRPEWTRLFNHAADVSPFQSPSWLIAWWKYFGEGRLGQLWTLTFRKERGLVGLLPLYIERSPRERALKFIGTGVSDYLDAIFTRDHGDLVAGEFFTSIANATNKWDVCHLDQLPSHSPLTQWGDALETVIESAASCYRAPLSDTVNSWHESVSQNLIRNIHYCQRRAQSLGALSFEQADRSNLTRFMDEFFRLHTARWAARGEAGMLSSPGVEEFHREVAGDFLANGMLRLSILRFQGEPVAGVYGLNHRRTFYIYLTGLDPGFAKFSFGSIALAAAIEMAIQDGCIQVDFLRGREPYKQRFGAAENATFSLHCTAEMIRQEQFSRNVFSGMDSTLRK
jgi:CelD/BcsL family acetyltransferase involved in cellulose biosynthesis